MANLAVGALFSGAYGVDDENLFVAEILRVDEENNKLDVRIKPNQAGRAAWEEEWILTHTQQGFIKQVYRPLSLRVIQWDSIMWKTAETGRRTTESAAATMNALMSERRRNYPDMKFNVMGDGAMRDCYEADFTAGDKYSQVLKLAKGRLAITVLAYILHRLGTDPLQDDELAALCRGVAGEPCEELPEAIVADDCPEEAVCRKLAALASISGMTNREKQNVLIELRHEAKVAMELMDWDNRLLGEIGRMAQELGLCPPGYNNYYHDGIAAHNRGVLPENAPNKEDDHRVREAWLRGWSRAYEARKE